jgi:DNA polymerase III gamma/tau subunit
LSSEAEQQIRQATSPRWRVELLLIKLAHLQNAINLAALAADPAKKKWLNERILQVQASGGTPPNPDEVLETNVMLAPADRPADQQPTPQPDAGQHPSPTRRRPSIAIPTDLNAAQQFQIQKTATENEAEFDPDAVTGDAVPLSDEQFDAMLTDLKTSTQQRRPVIYAALNSAHHRIEGNRWVVEIGYAAGHKVLQEAKPGLVPYLRQRTGNPTLVMDLRLVEEAHAPVATPQTHTSQDVLEAMVQENPNLLELLNTFMGNLEY